MPITTYTMSPGGLCLFGGKRVRHNCSIFRKRLCLFWVYEHGQKSTIRVKTETKCMNSTPQFGSWSRFWNKGEARLGSHETWFWFIYSKRRSAWTRVSLNITNLFSLHLPSKALVSKEEIFADGLSDLLLGLALFCVRREVERGWVSCKWFRLRSSKQRCNWTEIRK